MKVKAEVIAKTTVNNQPAKVGDIVEVDVNTFANLSRKGRLKEVKEAVAKTDEPKKK